MRPTEMMRLIEEHWSALDGRLPATLDQINREGADGFPASTSGADPDFAGGTPVDEDGYPVISSSVEAAVLRRQRGNRHYGAIRHELAVILTSMSKLRSLCDRYDQLDTKAMARQARCFGGDPLCENLSAVRRNKDGTEALRYGGKCERCYMADYRARKAAESK